MKVLAGTGGWAYFTVPGDRLRRHSAVYDFVEVNSTFYSYPPSRLVESWRRRVRRGYEFVVRCHKELSHHLQFKLVDRSFTIMERMKRICGLLHSDMLVLQTSRAFPVSMRLSDVEAFLSSITLGGLQLAWEVRSPRDASYRKLVKLLRDHNVIHVTDLSRDEPAHPHPVVYSRLFGSGEHNAYQFSNEELRQVLEKAQTMSAETAYLSFHGMRMHMDAARLKLFRDHRRFPRVTSSESVESVVERVREEAKFPASRADLIRAHGWKICDWSADAQLRVGDVLRHVPNRSYSYLSDLIGALDQLGA
jgi:uncharacterized protein YecE (DUF72 family)